MDKEHSKVLRAIRNLECSPEFNAANFGLVGGLLNFEETPYVAETNVIVQPPLADVLRDIEKMLQEITDTTVRNSTSSAEAFSGRK